MIETTLLLSSHFYIGSSAFNVFILFVNYTNFHAKMHSRLRRKRDEFQKHGESLSDCRGIQQET